MNKKLILIISLLILSLNLSGCKKEEISQEEAANVFTNELIFQNYSSKFKNNFAYSKELDQALKKVTTDLSESFFSDLQTKKINISKKNIKLLTSTLLKKAKDVTIIKPRIKNPYAREFSVDFNINGLNYVNAIEQASFDILKKTAENHSAEQNFNQITDLTVEALNNRINQVEAVADPVVVSIKFVQKDKSYYIAKGQDDNIRNLYIAFLTGIKDQEFLNSRLQEVINNQNRKFQTENL